MARAPEHLDNTAGWILAGGRSSRMGRDKCLLDLAGTTLLQRVMDRLAPQVRLCAVNSSEPLPLRDDIPRIADNLPGYLGPLAGVQTGLQWLVNEHDDCPWLATVAVDTPFIPLDLVNTLHAARGRDSMFVCASSGGQLHPTCSLWHVNLLGPLQEFLEIERSRRMMEFVTRQKPDVVVFPIAGIDPFFNINTISDIEKATTRLDSADESLRQ